MQESLLIVGVNHRTAPVAVRERLAYADQQIVTALGRLRERAPALAEAALISTCNRVEIIGVASDPVRAGDEAVGFLAADREVDSALFASALYRFAGPNAARHLFRVGASLDSMVVGEPQILGQLKLAYAHAAEAGSVGLVLHRNLPSRLLSRQAGAQGDAHRPRRGFDQFSRGAPGRTDL
jgi:glutamyl-tRNA reductase